MCVHVVCVYIYMCLCVCCVYDVCAVYVYICMLCVCMHLCVWHVCVVRVCIYIYVHCVCVSVYMCGCTCVVCAQVHTQRPEEDTGVLLCQSLPYSLKPGSLTEPGVRLAALVILLPPLHIALELQVCQTTTQLKACFLHAHWGWSLGLSAFPGSPCTH